MAGPTGFEPATSGLTVQIKSMRLLILKDLRAQIRSKSSKIYRISAPQAHPERLALDSRTVNDSLGVSGDVHYLLSQ